METAVNTKITYPYTDEHGFTWVDEFSYQDNVGGIHVCDHGWNPRGTECGECWSRSCDGCKFEND